MYAPSIQNAGVREYWIVDPETQTIYIYLFESGRYCFAACKDADFVSVQVLDGCDVNLHEVFAD